MPVISMFYGIIILMFYFDNKKHHRPHIHVQYAEHEAIISIDNGEVLEGDLPGSKMKLARLSQFDLLPRVFLLHDVHNCL